MTRLDVNIYDAKTHLSRYLKKVQSGEVITLCKNGEPIAQIIPFPKKQNAWQHLGMAQEMIGDIPEDFNDPLTDEELPGFGL
jgi:prevent-host-death family protein